MAKEKKAVKADIPEAPAVEVISADPSKDIKFAVVEDSNGKEVRRYSPEQSDESKNFCEKAEGLCTKFNQKNGADYLYNIAKVKTGVYIDAVEKGRLTMGEYKKREALDISSGAEHELSWTPLRPLKVVYVR